MVGDDMPKISVLMSTYNDAEYIREAVESILKQSFTDFEFLIIDDVSSDNTVDIISSFKDPRIKLIRNEVNRGLTCNLNVLLEMAKGEYIARMDGDDISHPDRFEKQVKYLDQNPDVYLVGTDVHSFGATDLYWRLPDDSDELKIRMLLRPVFAHPSFMFRRTLIDEDIRYDESFRSAQDYELASRLARDYKIGRVQQILLEYRVHEKQISQTQNAGQNSNADRVRERLLSELTVNLTDEEKELYTSWIRERKLDSLSEYKKAYGIIDKIVEGNKKVQEYSVLRLPVVLKKMLYTWIIRSKSIKYVLGFPYICGFSLRNINLFIGEIFRTIKEKLA